MSEAEVAYHEIEHLCRLRFPRSDIRWAFTSKMIRGKLAAAGRYLDSPTEALVRLAGQGYRHVAVQSLHVICGRAYEEMIAEIDAVQTGQDTLRDVKIGLPLLASRADIRRVSQIMVNGVVPGERQPDEAVVWMGHGSRHHAEDAAYGALAEHLRRRDPLSFIATVEGRISWENLVSDIRRSGVGKAWLLPFMAVAGDHARNDLAGDDGDSFKSAMESEGIRCLPVIKGIAEYESIAGIWMDHLAAVWGYDGG